MIRNMVRMIVHEADECDGNFPIEIRMNQQTWDFLVEEIKLQQDPDYSNLRHILGVPITIVSSPEVTFIRRPLHVN